MLNRSQTIATIFLFSFLRFKRPPTTLHFKKKSTVKKRFSAPYFYLKIIYFNLARLFQDKLLLPEFKAHTSMLVNRTLATIFFSVFFGSSAHHQPMLNAD